jgi:hypothetical protein
VSDGHFYIPTPGGYRRSDEPPKKKARPAKGKRKYPVAAPYAPPPNLNRPAAPPTLPADQAHAGYLSEPPLSLGARLKPLLLLLLCVACVGAGWFLVRGPGIGGILDKLQALLARKKSAVTVVAEAPNEPPAPEAGEPKKPAAKDSGSEERPKLPPPIPDKPPQPKKEAEPTGVVFEKHVLPIFEAKCMNCHNDDKRRGGLNVLTAAALFKGGESGPSLMPGFPERSLLWQTIRTNEMPPTPNKLTPAEKKIVQDWIAGGAKSSAATAAKP